MADNTDNRYRTLRRKWRRQTRVSHFWCKRPFCMWRKWDRQRNRSYSVKSERNRLFVSMPQTFQESYAQWPPAYFILIWARGGLAWEGYIAATFTLLLRCSQRLYCKLAAVARLQCGLILLSPSSHADYGIATCLFSHSAHLIHRMRAARNGLIFAFKLLRPTNSIPKCEANGRD